MLALSRQPAVTWQVLAVAGAGRGRDNEAYLSAVSWVVYNGCLGFLGGGRRHFTMQGRGMERRRDGGGAPGKDAQG